MADRFEYYVPSQQRKRHLKGSQWSIRDKEDTRGCKETHKEGNFSSRSGTDIQEQDRKESQKNQTKPSTEWKGQSQSTKEIEGWDLLENLLTQQAHLVFALTKETQAASPRDEDFGYK
ncbi:hypothetical protein Tco_1260374 [Tanacetum coccineum]